MAEQVLEVIVAADSDTIENFPQWFTKIFEDYRHRCSIEEFAIFFLSLIRTQTEEFTKCNSSTCNTPKKLYTTPANRKLSITNDSCGIVQQRGCNDGGNNAGNKTISRDLFVQKSFNVNADDFHNDFIKIDDREQHDLNKRDDHLVIQPQQQQTAMKLATNNTLNNNNGDNIALSYERNENESKYSICRKNTNNLNENESDLQYHNGKKLDKSLNNCNNNNVDMTFSPIILQKCNVSRNSNYGNSSTPIKSASKSISLNTSTPIANTTNRSKGSKHSTPNDSRKSHDKSFSSIGNNSTHTIQANTNARRQTSSPCLGDFISYQMKTKRKSTTSNKSDSIFSENDFPNLNNSTNPCLRTPTSETKPKKRVAPITISKSISNRHDFTSSSFKSDNNLITFMNDSENEHKDERGMLKNYKDIIKRNFEAADNRIIELQEPNKILQTALKNAIVTPNKLESPQSIRIDLSKVTNRLLIDRLVDVYSLIIDLNLTPNILTEISYLINLINTEYDPYNDNPNTVATINESNYSEIDPRLINHQSINNVDCDFYGVLKNLNNCVYFSLETLNKQKSLLALLDITTIRVLIDNDRLTNLNQSLHGFLKDIHTYKSQLDSSGLNMFDTSLNLGNNSINNVFYQQENDTKEHFPSDREFGAFKKQRDVFYSILRAWEFKHLNSAWNFLNELGGKVKSLLAVMEHPINMAHLAKLFTAQLIISCNFDNSTSELQMALPNIDLTKLSKLRQRLVAPSIFSTQYLFPGNQAFFRDFIIASENNILFIEQLKIVLIHELQEMNDSSYEVLNISSSNDQNDNEYVVRPESTSTMRVLAKFVGYIISRPFNYESYKNIIVDNRQIELRNSLFPVFDIKTILLKSISEKKLIITIPWLVQYIAMLDTISLRLNYYKDVFSILYELYISTNVYEMDETSLTRTPTSKFIIRTCLGWLFEHPNIPEEYYTYRQNRKQLQLIDCRKIEVYVDKSVTENLDSNSLIITKINQKANNLVQCDMQSFDTPNISTSIKMRPLKTENNLTKSMNPLLESILNAACPFLADFRVSVMPSRVEKTVSRTGRYRHITTKFSGTPTIATQQKSTNNQNKLLDAFLQTQTLSVRRTIEFIIERTTSAVVKDFQMYHLFLKKKLVSDKINLIDATDLAHTVKEIYTICSNALTEVNLKWDSDIPDMLRIRIKDGFDALLPRETLDAVKVTCMNLSMEKCLIKTNDWRVTNMMGIELFCKDVQGDAAKLLRNTSNKIVVTPLHIEHHNIAPSLVFEKLQEIVHAASLNYKELELNDILEFLTMVRRLLNEQNVTKSMHRILAFMLLQLVLLLITNRCDLVTLETINLFISIWMHNNLLEFTTPRIEDDDNLLEEEKYEKRVALSETEVQILQQQQISDEYIFSNLISKRLIRLVQDKECDVFLSLASFINQLVEHNLITISILNEQFVKIFNEDWHQNVLAKVSDLMESVLKKGNSKHSNNYEAPHSQMFLEMLSDLAIDMEDF